jgi:hypothetical protein
MDNECTRQQDWRESEVEAFRQLLAARAHPDSQQRPTAEADQTADVHAPIRRPRVSLFEPDQLNPDSGVALPTPAGNPQLVSASATHQRRPRRWLRLALALTLALGLSSAGFFLGSSWTARDLDRGPAGGDPGLPRDRQARRCADCAAHQQQAESGGQAPGSLPRGQSPMRPGRKPLTRQDHQGSAPLTPANLARAGCVHDHGHPGQAQRGAYQGGVVRRNPAPRLGAAVTAAIAR